MEITKNKSVWFSERIRYFDNTREQLIFLRSVFGEEAVREIQRGDGISVGPEG